MSRLRWRWEEKEFGFRFRAGSGKRAAEHYQAGAPGDFYVIPASQRKLNESRAHELAALAEAPTSPRVVPNPWKDYERDWDWILGPDGILLNYAGAWSKKSCIGARTRVWPGPWSSLATCCNVQSLHRWPYHSCSRCIAICWARSIHPLERGERSRSIRVRGQRSGLCHSVASHR